MNSCINSIFFLKKIKAENETFYYAFRKLFPSFDSKSKIITFKSIDTFVKSLLNDYTLKLKFLPKELDELITEQEAISFGIKEPNVERRKQCIRDIMIDIVVK